MNDEKLEYKDSDQAERKYSYGTPINLKGSQLIK